MTDLVERLRTPSSVRSWEEADRQREEAAAEIERLRAEVFVLRDAIQWWRRISDKTDKCNISRPTDTPAERQKDTP